MENLVEEAKLGNKEIFSELFESVRNDLHKVALSRLRHEDDSQDVVQETFITAFKNIHSLRESKYFKTWIIRILINKCNAFHKKKKFKETPLEEFLLSDTYVDNIDSNFDFEQMIKGLNEEDKELFRLYFKYGLTLKEISALLDMNENTTKTKFSRGKAKLSKLLKPATLATILIAFIATSVVAVCVINYIKGLFELNSVGKENDGVLMAIENLDWFQQTDMNYIDLGNGYKIRLDYLLLDEMNLYLVFDFESEEDISKYTDILLKGLKIVDENGEIICNEENAFSNQYKKKKGDKLIESSSHHMKSLVYMYTDSFPISKTLDISFSGIKFLKKSNFGKNGYLDFDVNANFEIDLADKFVNRHYISYNSENSEIEKAIITETGFYAIIQAERINKPNDIKLIDENGNSYNCYFTTLTDVDTSSKTKYIVTSNFNNVETNNLKLVVDNVEYVLTN